MCLLAIEAEHNRSQMLPVLQPTVTTLAVSLIGSQLAYDHLIEERQFILVEPGVIPIQIMKSEVLLLFSRLRMRPSACHSGSSFVLQPATSLFHKVWLSSQS